MCNPFSRCYSDDNVCLWTEGAEELRSKAQSKCPEPNYFIPRITNSDIQSKLAEFRSAEESQEGKLVNSGFWIDVNATAIDSFHWIDNSSLAGHFIYVFAGNVVLLVIVIIQVLVLSSTSTLSRGAAMPDGRAHRFVFAKYCLVL